MNQKFFIKFSLLLFFHFSLVLSGVEGFINKTQAQETLNYSIQQCIDYAIQNNVNAKNARLDEKEAKADVKAITGTGLPQVNLEADFNHNFEVPTQFLPDFISPSVYGVLFQEGVLMPRELGDPAVLPAQFGTKFSSSANLSLNQLLFNGSYFVGLQAARTYGELMKNQIVATETQIIENVKKAAYGVLVNESRVGLLDANIRRLNDLIKETSVLLENGFVEKIDLDRLKVAKNNLEVEKQKIQQVVEISNLLLKYQMGMPMKNILNLTDKLDEIVVELENYQVAAVDFNNRPEYSVLQTQKTLTELDIKNNKVGRYPVLVGFASVGANAGANKINDLTNFDNNWFNFGLYGVKLSVPIFDGFQRKNRIAQAKFRNLKVQNAITDLENVIEMQALQSKTSIRSNLAALEVQKQNLELAEEVLRVSKIKFKEGVGSNLEVTTAETDLKQAQTSYYSALYDLLIAKVDFEKAMGKL